LEKKGQISWTLPLFGVKKKPVKKGQIGKKKRSDLVPNLIKLVPSETPTITSPRLSGPSGQSRSALDA
jgi:hypothetical protein